MSHKHEAERLLPIDHTTEMFLVEWRKHRASKPDIPEEFAANVDHLRRQMDTWQQEDDGFHAIVSSRLAHAALRIGEDA